MKTKLKQFILCALCALNVVISTVPVTTYCATSEGPLSNSEMAGSADVIDKGIEVASTAKEWLVNLATAVAPTALIAGLLILMVTKDSKKVAGILYFLGIVILACIGILLVNGGYVIQTIQDLIGLTFN